MKLPSILKFYRRLPNIVQPTNPCICGHDRLDHWRYIVNRGRRNFTRVTSVCRLLGCLGCRAFVPKSARKLAHRLRSYR